MGFARRSLHPRSCSGAAVHGAIREQFEGQRTAWVSLEGVTIVQKTKARNRSTATGRARRCHTRAPDKSFLKGPQLLTHSKHPFYTTPDRNPTGQGSPYPSISPIGDKLSPIGEPYTYYHVEGGAKLT